MAKNTDDIVRLPMPDRLEPKNTARSLMASVKVYFYTLYNGTDKAFRSLLGSIGNKDAITGNRLFDRHEAVGLIKKVARQANDAPTVDAKDGDVYKCLVSLMRVNGIGLKLRKHQYRELTHTQYHGDGFTASSPAE
jgi:hypothetical protein